MLPYAYLQILFFISEIILLLLKRAKKAAIKNKRDNYSLLLLWIVIFSCMSIGPWLAEYYSWPFADKHAVVLTGMVITAIGFIIRWTAIFQLGEMFTVNVVISDKHTLKTTGLYKIVRHPSYLGLMLIIAGLAVCMNSVLSFLIMTIPTFMALNYRIAVEEKALTEEFGPQYESYKSKVNKLIPGIY